MSKVYALLDSNGSIIRIEGGYTMSNIDNIDDWVLIDEGEGDKFNLCQSHYLDAIFVDDSIPRYKLENGKPVLRSEDEIEADRSLIPQPVTPPTVEELAEENKRLASQLQASIESNAMLEDCLAEMAEIVYA